MSRVNWTPWTFAIYRFWLGLFLAWQFLQQLPFAVEMYHPKGLYVSTVPVELKDLNLLEFSSEPIQLILFIGALAAISVLLAFGILRQLCCLLLVYGFFCLHAKNPLASHVGLQMLAWGLLAITALPSGEPLSLGRKNSKWTFPRELAEILWLVFGVTIFAGALLKLHSPVWADGNVLSKMLEFPMARTGGLVSWIKAWPPELVRFLSYLDLALELLFFPLALLPFMRGFVWVSFLLMQLFWLGILDMTPAILAEMTALGLLFDTSWIKPRKALGDVTLFFDGVCGLCNSTVDFVMQEEQVQILRFSPLQSSYAIRKLGAELATQSHTLVLVEADQYFVKSTAVLRCLELLGGPWRLFGLAKTFPLSLRDGIYDFIAANRYRWFGRKDTCRIPTAEERPRFLL